MLGVVIGVGREAIKLICLVDVPHSSQDLPYDRGQYVQGFEVAQVSPHGFCCQFLNGLPTQSPCRICYVIPLSRSL